MPFWRLFYHVVWSTRYRSQLIDDEVEALLQKSIRSTCDEMKVVVHAVGTMPDHIHLALSIPPSAAVATVVGRVKGSAAHLVNHTTTRKVPFAWESEYAVLSFGARNLSDVVAYINNQPARHAANRLWLPLEPDTDRN